ncbi:GNAT family N-acetyltransferase [Aurantiacibacter poecillastricola]|uniref:GNAT family N-acetyltransferase n=1 Tax=Aurantiacibacter poecillastricola TaxID=3064385 RepID=UPI00273D0A65|nr:GNAT family N-acetyltransferase [Aurantiacibacter sp. 219JJ12-13]MDP5261178.1 GNAT family N-acetyltransferase [Aurantiacibacter sp. 219JJ12-13]
MIAPDWSLRLARPEDAEGFAEVEEDASQLLREEPSLAGIPLLPNRSAEEYRAIIARRRSLSALGDGDIIGFAAARPVGSELHLHELSVARAFQRRGIGSTLLRALKVDAANAGFKALTLLTYRDIAWNAPFYEAHGFAVLEDLSEHPRLAAGLDAGVGAGLPRERRCAMICVLE